MIDQVIDYSHLNEERKNKCQGERNERNIDAIEFFLMENNKISGMKLHFIANIFQFLTNWIIINWWKWLFSMDLCKFFFKKSKLIIKQLTNEKQFN